MPIEPPHTALTNTHYIVLSVNNRKYDFSSPEVLKMAVEELDYRRGGGGEIVLHLCLVLPKELHILLSITEAYGKPIKNFVNAYKRYISKNIKFLDRVVMKWEPGFHHEIVNNEAEFKGITERIMRIPLDEGYIPRIGGLPYILALPET